MSLREGGEYIGQLADNRGVTDEERAYNYLIARYDIEPALRALDKEFELSGVPTLRSRLSADNRRVVRVIYTFNGKGRNMPPSRKYFVRVDVTNEFPFIVTPWNRYLERGERSMTSMPLITDQMVEEFRQAGKVRASYSNNRNTILSRKAARVVPQQYYNNCAGQPNNTRCGDDCWCCDGFRKSWGLPVSRVTWASC